jgi:hypothetical protein
VNSAEATVGVADGGGGLAACGRAMQRRTMTDTAKMAVLGKGSGSTERHRAKRGSRQS